MSKYDVVYFVGDNQAINRVCSSKTRNRGAFSGSLAALQITVQIDILCIDWLQFTSTGEYSFKYKQNVHFNINIQEVSDFIVPHYFTLLDSMPFRSLNFSNKKNSQSPGTVARCCRQPDDRDILLFCLVLICPPSWIHMR